MKNVILTGPTRGLGLAIARQLVSEGYCVIGVSRSISQEYAQLISSAEPGKAIFIPYDLNNLEGIHALTTRISQEYGAIYGLVNNSAIGTDGLLATMHASDISKILRINLEAPILLSKFACRTMLTKSEGRIVQISSVIASSGFSGLAVYAASKSGLHGFARSLARELGRSNITVNCVAPGYMETDMTAGLGAEKLETVKRRAPLGLPKVDDAASAVVFLLSDQAARITGTTITVDGGSTA